MPTTANPDLAHPQLSLVPDWLNLFLPRLKHGKPSFGLSLYPPGVMSGAYSLSFVFFDVFLASFSPVPASPALVANVGFSGYWSYVHSLRTHLLNTSAWFELRT